MRNQVGWGGGGGGQVYVPRSFNQRRFSGCLSDASAMIMIMIVFYNILNFLICMLHST